MAMQQHATLKVLAVLQKLFTANPENIEDLQGELDEVLESELPHTGEQEQMLKAEAKRVLDHAKKYIDQITARPLEPAGAAGAAAGVAGAAVSLGQAHASAATG